MAALKASGHEIIDLYVSLYFLSRGHFLLSTVRPQNLLKPFPQEPSFCLRTEVRFLPIGCMYYKPDLDPRIGKTVTQPIRWGEQNDPGVADALFVLRLPRFIKKIWAWYLRNIRGDKLYADLLENFHEKTVEEYFALVAQREAIREQWWNMWETQKLDFILTVPNPLPASPHSGWVNGWTGCTYTFLFNIVSGLPRTSQMLMTLTSCDT